MCRTVIARAFAAAALAAGLAGTPSDVPVEVAGTRQAAFQLAATVQTARALCPAPPPTTSSRGLYDCTDPLICIPPGRGTVPDTLNSCSHGTPYPP